LDELLDIVLPSDIDLLANNDGFRYDDALVMGYAMKMNQKLPKKTDEVKKFVENLFNEGQRSGQKYTTTEMEKEIHKNFPLKEWLTWSQVKGEISKLKAKLLARGSTDSDPDPDLVAQLQQQAQDEIDLETIVKQVEKAKEVLNNTSNWLTSHPLEVNFNLIIFMFYHKANRDISKCQFDVFYAFLPVKLTLLFTFN
jgi:hypothetical protein